MNKMSKRSWVEQLAVSLGLIPELELPERPAELPVLQVADLATSPPPERWDDWIEYEAKAWPAPVTKEYQIVPTTCFNCESACGLLGYVDKATGEVRRFEGNPYHPGSRGRNCAKGPATINQIQDRDRILYPLKRKGKRGAGEWQRVSWEECLTDIAGRIAQALREKRNNEVVYHVGRPGHENYIERVLQAWGVDGHNSHTNICSAGARLGYAIWQGYDRPSPDHANANFILLISAHLESGHYFNPHAQRIIEGKLRGAKLCVLDPRLSNTASVADYWLPTQPGSEVAVLLAIAKLLLEKNVCNRTFLHDWVNWKTYLNELHPSRPQNLDEFLAALEEDLAEYTPEFAEAESGVPAGKIREVAAEVARAGTRLATHNWRSAASGNLGGWSVSRALHLLNVLTGSVGTEGGTSPSGWNKVKPKVFDSPPAQQFWNKLHFPNEFPLAHYEMSFLLPHFLKEGRGRIDTYFTRVFNPVWSYPDGFSWIEMLSDETKIGLHVALTPTWNETAYFADYVLPMGLASERHDFNSYETDSGRWIAFRQPILREAARRRGEPVEFTYQANPGEVWEEDEFWIELSWRMDPDGSLGVRKHFLSPYRENEKITIDEYYQFIFEQIPELVKHAATEGLSPLDYMRRYGAFLIEEHAYQKHLTPLGNKQVEQASIDPETGLIRSGEQTIGVEVNGQAVVGFNSPSRKQEIYSTTMRDWGWPEHATVKYIRSHIHPKEIDRTKNEFVLTPTFRLPTLIHSRSGNAKWLAEISNRNPLWIHPSDAEFLNVKADELLRVSTEIGYFVDRVWITESIKPGIVACSHHLGRWRRPQDPSANRWAMNLVDISEQNGVWTMRLREGVEPYQSDDPDSARIFWKDGGVHQNLTFPVQPDPISGMHCWHQKVRLERALADDRYGDVQVDTKKSFEVYRRWMELTRPAPGPNNLRRPLWLNRPLRPADETFYLDFDSIATTSVKEPT